MDIVPFGSAQLPAYLQNRKALAAAINKDVVTAAQYPTLSIKGKVFTLVRDNERKIMMNPNDADETAQSLQLNVIRANVKARVYYAGSYNEGDNTPPTCASNDGIVPTATASEPQSKKCAICPHAVWGTKLKDDGTQGEGTECAVNTRLAVTAPDDIKTAFLLRVPAGSRKNYADAVKAADARGLPYNALVFKVSFDPTAPSPKLVFKPVGLLPEDAYAQASAMYENDGVKGMIGVAEPTAAPVETPVAIAGPVNTDELDAAIAARSAVTTAKAAPAPAKVSPKVRPVEKSAADVSMDEIGALVDKVAPAKVATAPVQATVKSATPAVTAPVPAMEDLMAELGNLLDMPDD